LNNIGWRARYANKKGLTLKRSVRAIMINRTKNGHFAFDKKIAKWFDCRKYGIKGKRARANDTKKANFYVAKLFPVLFIVV
jgi:hypothetical protein